jgi:hypothetical protein
MRYARLLVALAVVLSTVPGGVAADVIGFPDLKVTLTDDSVVPGEETTLELVVANSGQVREGSNENPDLNSRVTTARGLTVTAKDRTAPIDIDTETKAIGRLPEGSATVAFETTVDEDATPGTYTVPVETEYTFTNIVKLPGGEEITIDRTRTFEVTLEVEDDAQVSVRNVSSRARVGSTGTVEVTVENTGTEAASDATLQLESRNAELTFGGSSTASRQLGEWDVGERRTVAYEMSTARTARSQSYAVDATLAYEDGDGVDRTSETRTLSVTPMKEQTFSVVSTESTVAVGDQGTVTVEMRNDGPIPVTDATVELVTRSGDVSFAGSESATRFAGAWAPNETRTLEFDATASDDADPRSYALDAAVSYRDGEGDSETAPTRSLGVTLEPEQSFTFDGVSSTLAVGSEGTLEGTVTNTGGTEVRNAVVVFESEKPNVTPIETEAPVGDLGAGESAEFSLPLEISESAEPGPQQYSLAVRYRNSDGDLRTSDSTDVRREVGPDDREFDLEVAGASVEPGSGTVLEVTVTNTGSQRLTGVSANMFADSPMSVEDDEAFVGSLEPGDSETVRFSVGASGNALEKNYPVSLDFQYDEPDGDTKLSDTYRIAVSVENAEDGGGGLPVLPLVAVAALVVVAVYLYRRKRG